jgi:hypothetical protein
MKKGMILVIGLGFVFSVAIAQANMIEMKAYKAAYPDAKIKCVDCHADAMPKKDKHDMSEYGKAVIAKAKDYKAIGKVEDFKKK